MNIKTDYEIGDIVWIAGITRRNNKLVKGKVILKLNIPNYSDIHYVIEIPTEIEPLLEIRNWATISQDEHGPVGLFRNLTANKDSTNKFISKLGYTEPEELEDDEPTAEQIHKAIEQSIDNNVHPPLVLKETKTKTRRRFSKRRIQS